MFLLDTNVVSESRKIARGTADQNVKSWIGQTTESELFLSAVTIQELETGVLLLERRDPVQAHRLREWLEQRVLLAFDGRILPVDIRIARRSAVLHVPNPCDYRDAFIAGTALVHDLTVVTRNVGDFASTGVRLLNPWSFDGSR